MDDPRPAILRSTSRRRLDGEARAIGARPLSLAKSMTLEDAFRVTVLECLAHIAANVAAVTRHRDVEGLHQLRVGLRRLHVAFGAFGDEFRTPVLGELKARTKAFSDLVAPARDLDVFIDELFEPVVAKLGHDETFKILRARAERARERAWDDAVEHLARADFSVFQDDAAAAAEARSWLGRDIAGMKARLALRAPVTEISERVLDEQLMRVRKRARGIKALEHRECHRLRIAVKKLRYTAEFYGPLYRKKSMKCYVNQLKTFQDLLGHLNDAAQVRAALSRLTADETTAPHVQADLCFAAGLVNGWHCARAERLGKKVLKRWDKVRRRQPFWA